MRGRSYIILSIFCLIPLFLHAQDHDAAISTGLAEVEGRVTDGETGEPLSGAHVFLSGTKNGTVTDHRGNYRLLRIQPGAHRLVFSMIGYKGKVKEIVISAKDQKQEATQLTPVVYEMEEIYVGNLDEKWKKKVERFNELFIGETARSDSVEILNPEVLRFENRWWGLFAAEALAPLQIVNHTLGYHITYYLAEFRHTGNLTRWDGEPLFRELTPSDSTEAARWEENREKAFSGSLRHFLIALAEDRIEEEGFLMYTHRRNMYGTPSSNSKVRTHSGRLLRPAGEENLYNMRFSGRLEVIYTLEEEEPGYVRWARDSRSPASVQTSFLELNEWPVTIDADGEMLEAYGATQFGYFSYLRIGDITPREFRSMNSGDEAGRLAGKEDD